MARVEIGQDTKVKIEKGKSFKFFTEVAKWRDLYYMGMVDHVRYEMTFKPENTTRSRFHISWPEIKLNEIEMFVEEVTEKHIVIRFKDKSVKVEK